MFAGKAPSFEKWSRGIRAAIARMRVSGEIWHSAWKTTAAGSELIYTVLVKLPWALAAVLIGVIVVQGLTQHTTVIKDISVPKDLADNGYTSDVAGHRLRDALHRFNDSTKSRMRNPEVAMSGDLPNIVVPTVGISLDAIVSSLRTLLRSTRSRTVSGEITADVDKHLWLTLRIDGRKFYSSQQGVDPTHPDRMFEPAAAEAMKIINPYLYVLGLERNDPEAAFAVIPKLLADLPPDNETVPWLYSLRGRMYLDRKRYEDSEKDFKTAIQLNPGLAVTHVNYGLLYSRTSRPEQATAEYQKAIALDPQNSVAHNNLGTQLKLKQRIQEAIAEFEKSIELDRKFAMPYRNLGNIYADIDEWDQAERQYRRALEINENDDSTHFSFALLLSKQNRSDEAISEYRLTIKANPRNAGGHNNLGLLLKERGEVAEAEAQFRAAIESDNRARYHINLGDLLAKTGRLEEAKTEYNSALAVEPDSDRAKKALTELAKNELKQSAD